MLDWRIIDETSTKRPIGNWISADLVMVIGSERLLILYLNLSVVPPTPHSIVDLRMCHSDCFSCSPHSVD